MRPHTTTHTNYGRISLDEGTARHKHLYLTTHDIQNIQTSMQPTGFEPAIPASEWPPIPRLSRRVHRDRQYYIQFFFAKQIFQLFILG